MSDDGIIEVGASADPLLYKAIADEASGEIEVKQVNLNGTVVGDATTFKTLP